MLTAFAVGSRSRVACRLIPEHILTPLSRGTASKAVAIERKDTERSSAASPLSVLKEILGSSPTPGSDVAFGECDLARRMVAG